MIYCTVIILSLMINYFGSTTNPVLHVKEESPAGTIVIANLFNYLGSPIISSQDSQVLAIGNSAMRGVDNFAIDYSSKSLVLKSPPDRDLLCPKHSSLHSSAAVKSSYGGIEFNRMIDNDVGDCRITVSVIHGASNNPSFSHLIIYIDDINDHAPVFRIDTSIQTSVPEFVLKIKEQINSDRNDGGTELGKEPFRFAIPQAFDMDSSLNGIKGYRLEGKDAHMFHLEFGPSLLSRVPGYNSASEINSHIDTAENQLWLVPTLSTSSDQTDNSVLFDFETRNEFRLKVLAYDGGTPQQTGTLQIKIELEDINDHSPIFTQPFYTGKLTETDLPGTMIVEVGASDEDSIGGNAKLKFRIPGKIKQHLTGVSESQRLAAKLFELELAKQNERFVPLLGSESQQNVTRARLVVKQQSESIVRRLIKSAIVHCKKLSGASEIPSNYPFIITPSQYDSGSPLKLSFIIEVYDNGYPQILTTQVPVYLELLEVNDESPEIFISYIQTGQILASHDKNSKSSWGHVLENIDRAMLAQITITDPDQTEAGLDLTCTLTDARFSIEPITGHRNDAVLNSNWKTPSVHDKSIRMFKLMLNTQLDRESFEKQPARIEFEIKCIDNVLNQLPGGQLTSRMPVRIVVLDQNDNRPQFDRVIYEFHVPENQPLIEFGSSLATLQGFFIGQVTAFDKDDGQNAKIEYKLGSTSLPSGSISIESENGKLYLLQPLDRESIDHVDFQVLAIDQYGTDGDSRLTASVKVKLIIDDANDCPPVFDDLSYHFEVEEGIDLVKIGQLHAADLDSQEAGRIAYRLGVNYPNHSPANSKDHSLYEEALELTAHFQIDSRTGHLSVKARLDRERKSHYEFTVLAIDNPRAISPKRYQKPNASQLSKTIQHTSSVTVHITVLDHNDNAPKVLTPRNHAEFTLSPEQFVAGNTVFTIHAIDPDQGANGTVHYELVGMEDDAGYLSDPSTREPSGNHTNQSGVTVKTVLPFAIDQASGVCYLHENLPLHSRRPRAYLLRIRVYDLGLPVSMNASLVVRVMLTPSLSVTSPTDAQIPSKDDGYPNTIRAYTTDSTALIDSISEGSGGSWMSMSKGRISDRTMIVILSTVFVLLLLTTLVLLLMVRYRRVLLRTTLNTRRSMANSVLDKENPTFVMNKSFPMSYNGPPDLDDFNSEIHTAPWANKQNIPVSPYSQRLVHSTRGRSAQPSPNSSTNYSNASWMPYNHVYTRTPLTNRLLFTSIDYEPNSSEHASTFAAVNNTPLLKSFHSPHSSNSCSVRRKNLINATSIIDLKADPVTVKANTSFRSASPIEATVNGHSFNPTVSDSRLRSSHSLEELSVDRVMIPEESISRSATSDNHTRLPMSPLFVRQKSLHPNNIDKMVDPNQLNHYQPLNMIPFDQKSRPPSQGQVDSAALCCPKNDSHSSTRPCPTTSTNSASALDHCDNSADGCVVRFAVDSFNDRPPSPKSDPSFQHPTLSPAAIRENGPVDHANNCIVNYDGSFV